MNPGTTKGLESMGLRDLNHPVVALEYPDMPGLFSGWTKTNAWFKEEDPLINIGLGKGAALDYFNDNIQSFRRIR